MTVQVQIPYNSLEGDGTLDTFVFTYGLTEEHDLYVKVDGVEQIEFTNYTVGDVNTEGGSIIFEEDHIPADGAVVLIYRFTTRSQEIDYITGEPFPLETHEGGFDKFMRILQELIMGTFTGLDDNGEPYTLTFDLSVTQQEFTITIVNSGGTDAVIPDWESGTLAGAYHGTTDLEANIPADESVTTKEDGHVWLGI